MPFDPARVRAICFDIDGTLSDTDDQWVATIEKRLHYIRWIFPGRQVRPFARWAVMCADEPGNLVYNLLDRANLDQTIGWLYGSFSRLSLARKRRGFWLMRDVEEMLCRFSASFPLAVVSARDHHGTLAFLEQFKLAGFFRAVATALTCRHAKPFPDQVLWAADQMCVPPENCLMVGDTAVDIRAGKAAGAQTVGVLCGFGHEWDLRRAGADLILPHTAALLDVLLPPAAQE